MRKRPFPLRARARPSRTRTRTRTGASCCAAGIDLSTLADRRIIRASVEKGQISGAISRTDDLCPDVLGENPALLFRLRQQQLVELVREGKVSDAIAFAQHSLAPMAEQCAESLGELERTMLLLAYEDVHACPEAGLLDQAQPTLNPALALNPTRALILTLT